MACHVFQSSDRDRLEERPTSMAEDRHSPAEGQDPKGTTVGTEDIADTAAEAKAEDRR